jgi:hypothetical protein
MTRLVPLGRKIPTPALAACAGLALALASCATRIPVLVPDSAVAAAEGYGQAVIEGAALSIKGRFAFNLRDSGLARIEGFDPLGRPVFILISTGDKDCLILPRRKVYTDAEPGALGRRFLSFGFSPREAVELLCGRLGGGESQTASGWTLERDAKGRLTSGVKDDFRFQVGAYFPGGGVPSEVRFIYEGRGRLKITRLRFNQPLNGAAFDLGFLARFRRVSPEEMEALISDEN